MALFLIFYNYRFKITVYVHIDFRFEIPRNNKLILNQTIFDNTYKKKKNSEVDIMYLIGSLEIKLYSTFSYNIPIFS